MLDKHRFLDELNRQLPLENHTIDLQQGNIGLVLVDPVVGFTTRGYLADPTSMQPMVRTIDALCRAWLDLLDQRLQILVFRDHHAPDQMEPPYPPHCQEGSGEEALDPLLTWLESHQQVTLIDKDCINGVIGALVPALPQSPSADHPPQGPSLYRSVFFEWLAEHAIDQLVVCGDCTDICVLDFVTTALSARNHGLFGQAHMHMPINVFAPACATYHLPDPQALSLPPTARHDRDITHHVALSFMQARGAHIATTWRHA